MSSPSPFDTRPRLFQPGSLIDSKTYEQILSNVYAPANIKHIDDDDEEEEEEQEEQDDNDDNRDKNNDNHKQQLFNQKTLNLKRHEQEIEQLTQLIRRTQPTNDNITNIIMQQLNDMLQTTIIENDNQAQNSQLETSSIISTTISKNYPYPPINQTGPIKDHDRPYADYGHLNRQTIAQECQFNLQPAAPPSSLLSSSSSSSSSSSLLIQHQSIRLHAKSFAITSWTNVSKETVMNEIKHEFGIENIQYICIGEEISELNHQRHLHIQIIFKEKIDRRKPFLDEITKTHCNYQVTRNDRAWNEYIKKGGNYIEFNEFKSTKTRGEQKQWPSLCQSSSSSPYIAACSSSSSSSAAAVAAAAIANIPIHSKIPTTTGGERERTTTTKEKQRQKETIARHAFNLAKTNIHDALIFMRDNSIANDFLRYSHWYKNTFTLIYLLEQYELAKTSENIIKEYTWPESFPDCTPELRQVVDNWIRTEFHRRSRAKCLILIGGTGTGKTTFAKSLSGQYNYFQGRWRLDSWKDSARYLIFDDIPWDKFDQLGFPSKKALLTQNGLTMVTDKYKPSTEINIRQPAIVLLNPDDAGSLVVQELVTIQQQQIADYWQQRAIIYRMGSDESFYKSNNHHRNNNDDNNHLHHLDNNPSLSIINTTTNHQELEDDHASIDIFDELTKRAQHKHLK